MKNLYNALIEILGVCADLYLSKYYYVRKILINLANFSIIELEKYNIHYFCITITITSIIYQKREMIESNDMKSFNNIKQHSIFWMQKNVFQKEINNENF